MASIFDWSTTAASNSAAPPDGAPEGTMLPGDVNNTMRQMMADIIGANLVVDATGGDSYVCTLVPAPSALKDKMSIRVRFSTQNTTSTPTLNPNTFGAATITKYGGQALAVGDIAAGMVGSLTYIATGPNWELQNPVPVSSPGAGVTMLTFNSPLTGGVVTSTGSAGVLANGITNSFLAQMPPNTIKLNNTASTANAIDGSVAQARSLLGLGTAALLDTGTAAGNVVKLDGSGKLPAVDGSQLTNLAAAGSIRKGTQNVAGPNFSNSTVYTQAHALTSTPTDAQVYLECTTADIGYSVGARVKLNYNKSGSGVGIVFDATNSYILTPNSNIQIQQFGSPGGDSSINNARWKIVLTPIIV